jgi:hypothetical protein
VLEVAPHQPHTSAAENVDGRDDYHVVTMSQAEWWFYL